jgi:hypothetical protein
MSIWKQLGHLKKEDKWGSPDKMNGLLLWLLDKIEGMTGKKVIVHCGYDLSGHADKSFHKTGQAVDFHLNGLATKKLIYAAYVLIDSILKDLQVNDRVGLGVYLDWTEGTLGFHLDTRGCEKRWIRKNGIYDYEFSGSKLKC